MKFSPGIQPPSPMKYLLTLLAILSATVYAVGQPGFPHFLEGTWKMEDRETYEHWDQLGEHRLRGFAYSLKDGRIQVSEYLEVVQKGNEVVYTASVLHQDRGAEVAFVLKQDGNTFSFENPHHDFPKKISYSLLSENELSVEVSDGADRKFSYQLIRQPELKEDPKITTANPGYDPVLAEKLGGNEYGMKRYFLVILRTGSDTTLDKDFISESFRGHMENIDRLVKDGTLIVAGPLAANDRAYRGIFILNDIPDETEAQKMLQTDPAIKNGILDYEIFSWYGSAALPEYLPFSDKIWKTKP